VGTWRSCAAAGSANAKAIASRMKRMTVLPRIPGAG
jgi:hypothetical protein